MHAPHTHSNHTQRLHLLARHVSPQALDELACETKDTLAQTNLFPDRSLKNKLTVGVNHMRAAEFAAAHGCMSSMESNCLLITRNNIARARLWLDESFIKIRPWFTLWCQCSEREGVVYVTRAWERDIREREDEGERVTEKDGEKDVLRQWLVRCSMHEAGRCS